MRRLASVWLAVVAALLAVFGAYAALVGEPDAPVPAVPVLTALAGVGLLVADAVLPVASSAVMVVFGAVFGVAGGTLLGALGGMGALVLGAGLGRAGRGPMESFLGADRTRVEALVDRYGALAVVMSRPVPVLAESVTIVAAAAGLSWPRLLLAGLVGIVPVAFVFAVIGDRGGQGEGMAAAAVLIVLVLGSLVVGVARRPHAAAPGSAPRQ